MRVRLMTVWLLLLIDFCFLGLSLWYLFARKSFLASIGLFLASCVVLFAIKRLMRWLTKLQISAKAFKRGNFREAENQLLEAAELAKKFKPTDPRLGMLWNELGVLYLADAEYPDAGRYLRRALTLREQLFGPDHVMVGESLLNLGTWHLVMARVVEAEALYLRSQQVFNRCLKPGHVYIAFVVSNLACLRFEQGKFAQAEQLGLQARAMLAACRHRHKDRVLAHVLNNLGETYLKLGKREQAEALFSQSREDWETSLSPDHPFVAKPLYNLAECRMQRQEYGEARRLLKRARSLVEKALRPDHPLMAVTLSKMAAIYKAEGNFARAESLHRSALKMRESVLGPEHPDVVETLEDLADLCRQTGREPEASALSARARAIPVWSVAPDD